MLHHPRLYTIYGPCAPSLRALKSVQGVAVPPQCARVCCQSVPVHPLTAHSYPGRWTCAHFHATSGCRSTVCILRRAIVPAAAVPGLSAARKGCPSEVRFFVSNPICTRTCMHLNHLLTLTNMRVTGRTLYQPRNPASPGSHSPAYRPPQAFRPPEGRRSAAAKRCRAAAVAMVAAGRAVAVVSGRCARVPAAAGWRGPPGASARSRGVRRKRQPPPTRHSATTHSPRLRCPRAVPGAP